MLVCQTFVWNKMDIAKLNQKKMERFLNTHKRVNRWNVNNLSFQCQEFAVSMENMGLVIFLLILKLLL